MEKELEAFARDLAADIEAAIEAGEAVWKEHEFTAQVLERLAESGVLENPTPLTKGGRGRFGRAEYGISGFVVPDDEEPERVQIVTTIFRDSWGSEPVSNTDVRTAAEKAARFVEASFKGLHAQIEPANTDASDLARRLMELKDRIHLVRIVVLTDCLAGPRALSDFDRGPLNIGVDLFDLSRLHRVLGKGQTREDIELEFGEHGLPCLKAAATTERYDAYLSAVPASIVADVYERYGTRLLELNVRAFLGVRGRKSVNAGLRETILKSPADFLAFNNGIVATVDTVEIESGEPFRLRRLTGLQIVNGGQTTASLYRARRVDKATLDNLLVPVKFIHVRGGDLEAMVAQISKTANSQNTVQPADFSANDPFHVQVEKLSNETWCPDGRTKWFYDRARGAYEAAQERVAKTRERLKRFAAEYPKDKRFSKIDLAKYINAWEGLPHLVCFGGQKNFQALMQRLKDAKRGVDEIDSAWFKRFVAMAIIFRTTQKIVRAHGFPAYQANITAYLVAGLAEASRGQFDFDRVWRSQGLSRELLQMIEAWAPAFDRLLRDSAGARMPTEWSKREGCWADVRVRLPSITSPAPPELLAPPGG
jgi:hypothetical protein